MNDFDLCVKRGKLVKVEIDRQMVEKELSASEYDLESANYSMEDEDHKWATIQGYYSMFHAAKALVFNKGYREKSHGCLVIAIEWLYVREDILEKEHLSHFEDSMALRHQADYALAYTKEDAREVIENASAFLGVTREIVKAALEPEEDNES